MSGKYGVEQIKIVALFAVGLANCAVKAEGAGSMLGKAAAFLPALESTPALLSLKADELKAEWLELDAEDKAAVYAAVAEKFDLGDKDLEAKIEKLIDAGLKIADGLTEAVSAVTTHKAA